MLIACHVAQAAPLYVCTTSAGHACIDLGVIACVCCQPIRPQRQFEDDDCCRHDHLPSLPGGDGAQSLPCDCDHQPLVTEARLAVRSSWGAGNLVGLGRAQAASGTEVELAGMEPAGTAMASIVAGHTALANLASVCLRC
jgi:hypothetical protein